MHDARTIVAAIDFSECSGRALAHAGRLAAWSRGTLAGVHVVNVPALRPVPPALFPHELPTHEWLVSSAKQDIPEFSGRSLGRPLEQFEVRLGDPRDELVAAVTERGADVLVIGATSGTRRARGVGTVAAGCVRKAPCKVLVVRDDAPPAFGVVAACVDFSPTSMEALTQAVRFAALDNASLLIVHTYDDPWRGMSMSSVVQQNMPDFRDRLREAVEQRLREFAAPLERELGALKAQFHGVQADSNWQGFGHGLAGFLAKHGVDLAVLGVRSNWNVRDAIMGSTAERVFRDAGCSILTVRGPKPTPAGTKQ